MVKDCISCLNFKAEAHTLEEEEVDELYILSAQILSFTKLHSSMHWKKSQLNWLRAGDSNSKFFHSIMFARRRVNAIISIKVNWEQVEGFPSVRGAIFYHFQNHFKSIMHSRPVVEDLSFNSISEEGGMLLTTHFSEEEIKNAMTDCDSFKSPGPDDINLGF